MTGPQLCPRCKSIECQRIGHPVVQVWKLWKFWFKVPVGEVVGCTKCGLTRIEYHNGTNRILGAKEADKKPDKPLDGKVVDNLLSRVFDPDMNWE